MKHVLQSVKFKLNKHFESVCQALESEQIQEIMEVLGVLKMCILSKCSHEKKN